MAKWVGEAITNSHELQEVLSSLVAALPFRSNDNGDLIGFPEDAKYVLLLLSSSSSQRSNHVTPPHAVRNVQIDQRPSQQTPTGLNRIQLAPSPEPVSNRILRIPGDVLEKTTYTKPAGLREDAASRDTASCHSINKERHIQPSKDRFQGSFDTFFFHVEQLRLQVEEQRLRNPKEGESFRELAKSIHNSLTSTERNEWRQIHKQSCKGDVTGLDEAAAHKLLEKHHISSKLHINRRSRWLREGYHDHRHSHADENSTLEGSFED